jgi:hypothetical protein
LRAKAFSVISGLLLAAISLGQSGVSLQTRGSTGQDIRDLADAAVRQFAKNTTSLTQLHRDRLRKTGRFDAGIQFSLPTFIRTGGGSGPSRSTRGAGGDITLVFDPSGPRAFPQSYRDFLQSVFDQARPVMNGVFGSPANPTNVFVRNYDADIGDRDAVAGGYFLPDNGSGQMEIAFPIFNNNEAAAVNFVHTLLLAYQGQNPYFFDAFEEGLVRAATMKVVRTPGALPAGLLDTQVEAVLESTYDVSNFYDWYNQRALGGSQFIAPNLKTVPLPPGGSTGGLYLLRYQMAGTVWEKMLAEHPGFIAEFNSRFYLTPGIANNVPALITLGQQVLDFLRPSDPTVEGLSFAEWFRRQYILETTDTFGVKLLIQPIPITFGLITDDYGVFDIWTHYFETLPSRDEILLSGTSFPIFWEDTFNRFSTSSQEDRMSIAGGFGDVAPNFPNQVGNPYRTTVDIPVQDQIARVYLPAGAIATFANPTPNDFYGTVVGAGISGGATGRVQVFSGLTLLAEAPIRNGAFGTLINTSTFLGTRSLTVKVIRTSGAIDTEILSRKVNKGPGPLALDLRVDGDATFTFSGGLPKGLSMIGIPLEPFSSSVPSILGLPANDVLAARYNQARARYELFPEMESFRQGHGYFVRMPANTPVSIDGRTSPGTPTAVALRPGWNMISVPILETVPTTRVSVVKGTDFPKALADARGTEIGLDFFTFQPGPNDPASGAPETGSMVPATTFDLGKAYFVRVLSPEGAVLLFEPSTLLRPLSRSRDASAAMVAPTALNNDWQVKMSLTGNSRTATAFIGQSGSATRGFDSRYDSGMPPGMGGLQVWTESPEALFRDTRHISQPETYRVRLDGLVAGKNYSLKLDLISGRQTYVTLFDRTYNISRRMRTTDSHPFTARSSSHIVEISVRGNGQ